MNFMAWLSSFDELIYEVMSWILFLPITLWRTLRHPWAMICLLYTSPSPRDS